MKQKLSMADPCGWLGPSLVPLVVGKGRLEQDLPVEWWSPLAYWLPVTTVWILYLVHLTRPVVGARLII